MQRLEKNAKPTAFFSHSIISVFLNLRKIEIFAGFDMMTSKSVRRNVTRSWGLSLEKIEFFSTDFLRWVPMPQRDIPPFTFIYGHNYYVQLSKTICRHLFSSKNCSIHQHKTWFITTYASEANFEFSRKK